MQSCYRSTAETIASLSNHWRQPILGKLWSKSDLRDRQPDTAFLVGGGSMPIGRLVDGRQHVAQPRRYGVPTAVSHPLGPAHPRKQRTHGLHHQAATPLTPHAEQQVGRVAGSGWRSWSPNSASSSVRCAMNGANAV